MPKKSSPSKDSPGLFCLGGGGTAVLACGLDGISVVLGLAGGSGVSSPKRSMAG